MSISDIYSFLNLGLYTIGLWNVFKKLGITKWWALIPIYNLFKLAKGADVEEAGKVYGITYFLGYLMLININVAEIIGGVSAISLRMMYLLLMAILIVNFVYSIRIYKGVVRLFGRPRIEVILWVFFDGPMSLIYGFGKKHIPVVTYFDDIDEEIDENRVRKSSEHGLSINIKSRTAGDGLKVKTLLKDIHMNIEPGNMVLLLGGSGAGKTTFLNAVTGYEPADATILIDGENVYEEFDKLKYNIGFVPQQDLIRYKDTVYRTVADAALLKMPMSVSRAERHKRVEEVLNIFGLLPIKKNLVSKQSGGQKKRISIATEFVSDPSVFILDEPDSGLDGIMARDLMNRLHEISRQGKIVIVITHTPDRVIDLFDKVIVLAKDEKRTGRLVFYGAIDEAKRFFERDSMEAIVKTINRVEEGGEGRADELLAKYMEVLNGQA